MIRVYYRPPDQEKSIVKAFMLQLQEVSHSQVLILIEDFNHADICKQSRRILKTTNYNFLVQVLTRMTRNEALLELVCTNSVETVKDIKI